MPKLTNAAIVAAVMETGSITKAAEKLEVSRRTISGRLSEPECKRLLSEAQADGIREATNIMCSRLRDAVAIVYNLMADESTAPHIRLNAAQTLMQYAIRYTEIVNLEQRIQALEDAQPEGIAQ